MPQRITLMASHHADGFDEGEYPEPPPFPYAQYRETLGRRFPELGLYNVVHPIIGSPEEAELSVGDALDDLVDITVELLETRWRYENTSPVDAAWHFESTYRFHWGRHLRCLQRYLLEG